MSTTHVHSRPVGFQLQTVLRLSRRNSARFCSSAVGKQFPRFPRRKDENHTIQSSAYHRPFKACHDRRAVLKENKTFRIAVTLDPTPFETPSQRPSYTKRLRALRASIITSRTGSRPCCAATSCIENRRPICTIVQTPFSGRCLPPFIPLVLFRLSFVGLVKM